jgi:long-chain fatty acid transport protein
MRSSRLLTGGFALSTIAAALLSAGQASATNGYFTHGIGTHNKALAGAGTASPEQAIDAATNVAAGVLVGDRLDVGLAIFSPRREFTAGPSQVNGNFGAFTLSEGTTKSGSNWFPIPYIGKSWALENDRAITALFYGRGGMNTDYKGGSATFDPDGPGPIPVVTLPGVYGAGNTGVNLNQAFLELGYSWKMGNVALGIAPVIAIQAFEIDGVASFAGYTRTFAASGGTQFPDSLTNNGVDYSWGYGIKAGLIWEASERVRVSLSYQSETQMEEFDEYSDLFAQQGMFDIPAVTRAGISWQVSDRVTVHADIDHAQFGDIDSIAKPIGLLFNCPTAGLGGTNLENCLGGNEGAGFGWEDVTTYKIGVSWTMPDSPFTFRAGYNRGDQPIPSEEVLFNILAPATVEEHFTFGLSRKRSNGNEVSVAVMYAPEASIKGTSSFDPTQQIELSMHQFEVEFSYSW